MYFGHYCRSASVENRLRTETLGGIQSSDDRAHSIWFNTTKIIENKKTIVKEMASETPNMKLIAKCNSIIASCKSSIKDNMAKLGADETCAAEMLALVENSDVDGARIHLLKLLVKRNPGMYERKLASYQQSVKQK